MSVFTTVTIEQLQAWLQDYTTGALVDLKGISAGITNTNYFVTTTEGRYVLTLFEQNNMQELPFFIDLMRHLSDHGIPCPAPISNSRGESLHMLNGKPAVLISCLSGRDVETPNTEQCAQVGAMLAKMHMVGQSFVPNDAGQPHRDSRDATWREKTAAAVLPYLPLDEQRLLQETMTFQAAVDTAKLPQGVIHADLFRDNVLFDGDHIGGLIDFYYACYAPYLYDLAITVNDWCSLPDGRLDQQRLDAMFNAYQAVRPLQINEIEAWQSMLRIAALRFWLSRLYDKIFPQDGELTHAKDPTHFKNILQLRSEGL